MERFEITYPIDFRSGGDTTSQAIGKHREEIKKIYGHLNLLDSESLSGDEIKKLIGDLTNNISFDKIKGTLDGSKITGTLTNARVPGANVYGELTNATIPAKNVYGELTNATIHASKVLELISYLQSNSAFKTWLNSLINDAIKGNAGSDFPVGFIMPVTSLPITVPGSSSSKWESNLTAYVSLRAGYAAAYNPILRYNVGYNNTLSGGTTLDKKEYVKNCSNYGYNEDNRRMEVPKDSLLSEIDTVNITMGTYSYTYDRTDGSDNNPIDIYSWKRTSNDGYIKRIS